MKLFQIGNTDAVFDRIRKDPKQRVIKNIIVLLLAFWTYIVVASLSEIMIYVPFRLLLSEKIDLRAPNNAMLAQLLLTLVCTGLTFVFCLCIEQRSVRSLGLTRRKWLTDYLTGFLAGTGMMAAAVLASWGTGALTFEGAQSGYSVPFLIIVMFGWVLQGFSEELTFRGFLMMSVGTHHKRVTAVVVSALCFAAAHIGNDGISVLSLVNLTLYGVLMSVYFLKTDSIWGVSALHTAWNWAQGNLFGIHVSGLDSGDAWFRFRMTGEQTWIGGGTFGLEGGAATTAVLLITLAVVLSVPQRSQPNAAT